MKRKVPVVAVVAIALVIVAAVGYFALIRPRNASAAELQTKIVDLEAKVTEARLAQRQREQAPVIRVADLFDLSKAMPAKEDMPGVILELNSVANAAGIRFIAIAPQVTIPKAGYKVQPIQLTFHGNYFDLTDFLFRLRNLVTVRDSVLHAAGRLFTLDNVDFHESPINGFPEIEATLLVSAYVYDEASVAGAVPAPAPAATTTTGTTGSTDTTSTTTTGATTTSPATEAAGGTG